MAFGRNLTASEILDQALHFGRIEAVDHVVFMGMGEPLMNLDAVLAPASGCPTSDRDLAHDDLDRRLGPGDRAPGTEGPRVRLALSLHAADAARRQSYTGQRPLPARRRARLVPARRAARRERGLHRVPDARRRQRQSRAGPGARRGRSLPHEASRSTSSPEPDQRQLREPDHEQVDAVQRAALRHGCQRPCDRRADATSWPPAASSAATSGATA